MGRVEYTPIDASGSTYVGSLLYKGNLVEFIIDGTDLSGVKQCSWHYTPNGFVATALLNPATQKKQEVYMHNFLAKPAAGEVVQHRNGEGLDNRRANLRLVDEVEAATKSSKQRHVELPAQSGLTLDDIPKHIWYVQPNGYHRDRFAIELKREGILWKTTSSKKVSLKEKLAAAKEKLEEIYKVYPYLDPAREDALAKELKASFDAILGSLRRDGGSVNAGRSSK